MVHLVFCDMVFGPKAVSVKPSAKASRQGSEIPFAPGLLCLDKPSLEAHIPPRGKKCEQNVNRMGGEWGILGHIFFPAWFFRFL